MKVAEARTANDNAYASFFIVHRSSFIVSKSLRIEIPDGLAYGYPPKYAFFTRSSVARCDAKPFTVIFPVSST